MLGFYSNRSMVAGGIGVAGTAFGHGGRRRCVVDAEQYRGEQGESAGTHERVSVVRAHPSVLASVSDTPTILGRRAGSDRHLNRYVWRRIGTDSHALTPGTPPSSLQVLAPPANYASGAATPFSVCLTWQNSVGIVGRSVNVLADGHPAGTIPLVPDRAGLGIADGTSNIVLPFNTRSLSFAYDASGDLAASQTSSTLTMAATATNPFVIPVTLSFSNRGVAIPPGPSFGGDIQFRMAAH